MNKKLIRKMQTAAGGPLRIKFTPEQIALFESRTTRVPGMNNSGGNKYREEGVLALQHLEQEAKRKEEEIKSRMEMRPVIKRKTTFTEKLQGKKDEYELVPLVIGMSGADPLLSFYVGGVGLNGIGTLAKTGLWNAAKYTPTTQLGNWGRLYFVGKAFKNSFNEAVPTLTSQATSLLYLPAKLNESELTSLKFFERKPSKLTEAERKGFSKGKEYYTKELNESFLKQINDFAEKYGYTGLKEGNYTSEQLNAYARALIDRHNKFYRGVVLPIGEDLNLVKNVLGNKATNELILLHVATHSRGKDINPELYISPTTNAFSYGASGKTAIISRPYKLGKDRTKWFDEGDFNIVETGTVNPKSYNNFLGIVYPWESPKFLIYDPFMGKKIIPENYRRLTSLDIARGEGYYEYVPNPYVQNELISINNPMIFRLWVESPTLETLSKKTPDVPWQLSKIVVEKQGGKMNILEFLKNGSGIHIKEKNKGKFTKSAKAAGLSVQEHAKSVLNDPNATPLLKKRANFARNAAKWKHLNGGNIVFAKTGIKAGLQAKQNLTKRKAPDWDNLDRGYRYLTLDMNLPHDLAIAIMGNVVEESQGNYKAALKNGGGRGLIQWDGQPAPTGRYGLWGKIWASVAKPANIYDSKTDTIKNYWAPWNGLKGEQVRLKFINAPLKTKTKIYAESYLRPGKPRISDRQLSAMQLDSVYNPKIKNIIVNKEGGIIKAQEGTNLFEANKEIIPLSLLKKFFKQVYQDELNKNRLISAITGNVINTSPIVAEHEAFKLASLEAAGLNEQIKRNNKILEAQKLAQQSSDISDLIGDGLGIIADYFINKKSNKTSTGTSTSGTSSTGTSNYKVDSFWTNPSLSGGNQFKVDYTNLFFK